MRYQKFLTASQVRQHVEQSHALWGGGKTVEERTGLLWDRLQKLGGRIFTMSGLTDDDGNVVASLKRYYFDLMLEGKPQRCLGLGAIFTDAPQRAKGHAPELIKKIMDESRDDAGCGVALLFSDISPQYYRRFGFSEIAASTWRILVSDLPQAVPFERRALIPPDLKEMLDFYHGATSAYSIRTIRTPETWALFREINGVAEDWIIHENGKPVSLVSASPGSDESILWIDEWFECPGREERFWSTLRALSEERGKSELRGWGQPRTKLPVSEQLTRVRAVPMLASLRSDVTLNSAALADACFSGADHF